jgi:hypothetical protein
MALSPIGQPWPYAFAANTSVERRPMLWKWDVVPGGLKMLARTVGCFQPELDQPTPITRANLSHAAMSDMSRHDVSCSTAQKPDLNRISVVTIVKAACRT